MLAFASSVKHSDKLFGSAQVVMMATSNMVLLLLPLLLPAQVCHEPCNALYMLPYSSVSHDDQTLCTSNVAVCTQLMTQLVISHRTCLHPASPSWLSLSCVLQHCVSQLTISLCASWWTLWYDTCFGKGFPKSCKARGCQVVYCPPGLQMTTIMGTTGTTTMTTSVDTMVMSMATTCALVELQLLHLPLADASFKQTITMATTTTMKEVQLQLLLLQQVAMVHLLLQLPLQVGAVLPNYWLYD